MRLKNRPTLRKNPGFFCALDGAGVVGAVAACRSGRLRDRDRLRRVFAAFVDEGCRCLAGSRLAFAAPAGGAWARVLRSAPAETRWPRTSVVEGNRMIPFPGPLPSAGCLAGTSRAARAARDRRRLEHAGHHDIWRVRPGIIHASIAVVAQAHLRSAAFGPPIMMRK